MQCSVTRFTEHKLRAPLNISVFRIRACMVGMRNLGCKIQKWTRFKSSKLIFFNLPIIFSAAGAFFTYDYQMARCMILFSGLRRDIDFSHSSQSLKPIATHRAPSAIHIHQGKSLYFYLERHNDDPVNMKLETYAPGRR